MRSLLLIILISLLSLSFSDNHITKSEPVNSKITLKINIKDIYNNEDLTGVKLDIGDESFYSDLNGDVMLNIDKGNYNLETSYISYYENKESINIYSDTTLNIKIRQK